MAPVFATGVTEYLTRGAKSAAIVAGAEAARIATRDVVRRDLSVTSDSQKVTLGIIAVYVVVIAILWNVPYVRWSLWPFKVCTYLKQLHATPCLQSSLHQ